MPSDIHTPPMELGDVIDVQDFRTASRKLLERRTAAVKAFQTQAEMTAIAEADYQRAKAAEYVKLKTLGGSDGKMISAAEAGERLRGQEPVVLAQIERDTADEMLRARREDIAGVDEALAILRRLGAWSQQLQMRTD